FRKEQLSPTELDDLLGKVIASEMPIARAKVKKPKTNWLPFFNQWLRVAAILVPFVMAAVVSKEVWKDGEEEPVETQVEWVTLENPKGRKSKITLPDGTGVNLNYESRLRFPKVFEGDIRRVELIGEAFFEVVPNDSMPFIVQTNGIE